MTTVWQRLLLAGLLRTASSTVYPASILSPPTVQHDFQKNNVSSSWAPGYPIDWTNKSAIQYTFSDGGPYYETTGAINAAELSADEKFLVTVNTTNHVTVIDFATGDTVSKVALNYTGDCSYQCGTNALRILPASTGGGYHLLFSISLDYKEVHRLRLSENGTLVGNATLYPGGLLWDFGSPSVTHNARHFLTTNPVMLYDLDDANATVTINRTSDQYHDASFSPDDKLVAIAGADAKIFDTATGALVREFSETYSSMVSFSPDGSRLAATNQGEAVFIWDLSNATSDPITLKLPEVLVMPWTTSFSWSPDGAYLAAASYGHIFIWEMGAVPRMVQHYNSDRNDMQRLLWLKGTRQLAYRTFGGLEVYDFETNEKYRWGFNTISHWTPGPGVLTSTFLVKSRGWIGGLDADRQVRFWQFAV